MPEQLEMLIALVLAFLTTLGPVLICLVIPGLALMALFIGILIAGQRPGAI
jgi:hypothetical protein